MKEIRLVAHMCSERAFLSHTYTLFAFGKIPTNRRNSTCGVSIMAQCIPQTCSLGSKEQMKKQPIRQIRLVPVEEESKRAPKTKKNRPIRRIRLVYLPFMLNWAWYCPVSMHRGKKLIWWIVHTMGSNRETMNQGHLCYCAVDSARYGVPRSRPWAKGDGWGSSDFVCETDVDTSMQ